jgi:hypothetical protein
MFAKLLVISGLVAAAYGQGQWRKFLLIFA